MKKLSNLLLGISFTLSIYCISTWIYAFNTQATHSLRQQRFMSFYPNFFSLTSVSIICLAFIVASIILLIISRGELKKYFVPEIAVQFILLLFFSSQYL